jgi:hypothetical protein
LSPVIHALLGVRGIYICNLTDEGDHKEMLVNANVTRKGGSDSKQGKMKWVNTPGLQMEWVNTPGLQMKWVNTPGLQMKWVNTPGLQMKWVKTPGLQMKWVNTPGLQMT